MENKFSGPAESLELTALVGRALQNAEKLIHLELSLVRSELRKDLRFLSRSSVGFAMVGVGLLLALVLFSFGGAALLVEQTGCSWSRALLGMGLGYLIVFGLAGVYLQQRLSKTSLYPEKSLDSLKEAFSWKTLSKQS